MQSEQDITGLKVQMSAHKVKIDLQQCDISVLQEGWDGEGGRPAGEHGCRISFSGEKVGHSGCVVSELPPSHTTPHPHFLLLPGGLGLNLKVLPVEKNKKNTSLAINGS